MLDTLPIELNRDNIETFITELNCLYICPGNRNFRNIIQSRIQLNIIFPAHFENRTACEIFKRKL